MRTVIAVDLDTMRELADEEARVRARLSAIENVAFGAMIDLYQEASCYSFADHARVGELVTNAHNALAALCDYALAETTK